MTADPVFLLLDFDSEGREVVFVRADRREISERLRLSALDFPLERLRTMPLQSFLKRAPSGSSGRLFFLFHLPFAGSTFLAAILQQAGLYILRDPAMLDGLFLDDRTEARGDLASVRRASLASFAAIERSCPVLVRTAGYRPGMIKRLARADAFAGALYLYCDWRDFVCQVLKFSKRQRDINLLEGKSIDSSDRLGVARAACAFWLRHLRQIAELLDEGTPIRTIKSTDFFSRPMDFAERAARWMDAVPPDREIFVAEFERIASTHAKSGQAFSEYVRMRNWRTARQTYADCLSAMEDVMAAAGVDGLLTRMRTVSVS